MKTTLIAFALAALVLPLHAAKGDKAPKKKSNPQQVFKKKDSDGNGSLSKEEFVNRAKDPAKAGKAFARKDKDGNGKLSLDEFKAAPKKKKR
jgi:Ca2+-binding EF-hand superfamily protein